MFLLVLLIAMLSIIGVAMITHVTVLDEGTDTLYVDPSGVLITGGVILALANAVFGTIDTISAVLSMAVIGAGLVFLVGRDARVVRLVKSYTARRRVKDPDTVLKQYPALKGFRLRDRIIHPKHHNTSNVKNTVTWNVPNPFYFLGVTNPDPKTGEISAILSTTNPVIDNKGNTTNVKRMCHMRLDDLFDGGVNIDACARGTQEGVAASLNHRFDTAGMLSDVNETPLSLLCEYGLEPNVPDNPLLSESFGQDRRVQA